MRHHLSSFRNIYSAERKERSFVKKTVLFERRELTVFRSEETEVKVVGSYRPRSRFESFFAYFFCGEKKFERMKESNNYQSVQRNQTNKSTIRSKFSLQTHISFKNRKEIKEHIFRVLNLIPR